MGVWGGIGLASFGMGGLQALKPENVKAMKSFVDEAKFEELKNTYSNESLLELQNEAKKSQNKYSDSLYEQSNLFTKDDKGSWTANPDADQEKVKEFESLYKTETGTFGKNIQDYSNMEKQNRTFQKMYAAYQGGKIPASNFLAYAKQFDEAKDINHKVFQENLTRNVINEDTAGLKKTMASDPYMLKWLMNSGGLTDAVFATNPNGERSFYPYGIEKKNGLDPVHMPTGQLLTMSVNNLIQAVNLGAGDFQAKMRAGSAKNEENTPFIVGDVNLKGGVHAFTNLIAPVRELQLLMQPEPKDKNWVGFDKFPSRAKVDAKSDGMIVGLGQVASETFQQFFNKMPGDTPDEKMANLRKLKYDGKRLETLLQDDKSLVNQISISDIEFKAALEQTQIDGKDTPKTKEFADTFKAMFQMMKDKDGNVKYFLDPVKVIGYEMDKMSNYYRVTQENEALFQLPDSNRFLSVPGDKDGKIDEENLPKWLNDLSKHLASQGVPDPMRVATSHMQMLKSNNKISTPLADTNPTKSSIGWVQTLFGDKNTQATSIKIDDDQTVKAVKFKDLSKGGFNVSVIETPANAKLNGAVLIDDDSGKFPNVIMNVVKEAGKNIYVRLNSLGDVIAKFYTMEDFKKMFGESTDYFLGALKQLKGDPTMFANTLGSPNYGYGDWKSGVPTSERTRTAIPNDYNYEKGADTYDPESGHYKSVKEATQEEINRYELPEGSYLSIKKDSHPTLEKSIDIEAGYGRKPIQNILDGEVFFIPELEPLPPGMKDFVLPSAPSKTLPKRKIVGGMLGMGGGVPRYEEVPDETPVNKTNTKGIGTATPDVIPGYSSAREKAAAPKMAPDITGANAQDSNATPSPKVVERNYYTNLLALSGDNEPWVQAIMSHIKAETNFKSKALGDGETAQGPGQHMGSRLRAKVEYLVNKYGKQMSKEDKEKLKSLYPEMDFWDGLGTDEKGKSGKAAAVALATKNIVEIARRNGLLSDANEMDFLHYEIENNFGKKGGWNTETDLKLYKTIKAETLESPSILNKFRLGAVITKFIKPADMYARLKNIQLDLNGGLTNRQGIGMKITDEQVEQVAFDLRITKKK